MDNEWIQQGKQYMDEGLYTLAYHSFVLATRDIESASQDDIVFVSESLAQCASYIDDPATRFEVGLTCQHFDFTRQYDANSS